MALDINHVDIDLHAALGFLDPHRVVIDGRPVIEMTVRAADGTEAEAYGLRRLEESVGRRVKVLRCVRVEP